MSDALIERVLAAKRESSHIEFKQTFDVGSKQDWCEIVKDVVALANSGGGVLVFGADNKGQPIDGDLTDIAAIDPATIMDRIRQYTNADLQDLEIREVQKANRNLVLWIIPSSVTPFVFSQPGTYPVDGNKQKTAFGRGTVYFRHGAKSEPATTEDLAAALECRLEAIRREWLGGVRRVVTSPSGSRVVMLPSDVRQSEAPDAATIRITDDPSAPAYRVVDPDSTHPFRQKELIAEVRQKLPKLQEFNSFDVVAIRHVYDVDQRPEFAYLPKFGTRQYSQKFVEWVLARYGEDPEFFQKVRSKHRNDNV